MLYRMMGYFRKPVGVALGSEPLCNDACVPDTNETVSGSDFQLDTGDVSYLDNKSKLLSTVSRVLCGRMKLFSYAL